MMENLCLMSFHNLGIQMVKWRKSPPSVCIFLGGKENGEESGSVAKSEPELPLKPTKQTLKPTKQTLEPTNQTQMTTDLKVDTGLPCKCDLKPTNQTQMTRDLKVNTSLPCERLKTI